MMSEQEEPDDGATQARFQEAYQGIMGMLFAAYKMRGRKLRAREGSLPLTLIGGFLGSGKTTLLNHLLVSPHGRRLVVLVNDFGRVNIDASLVASHTDDMITLTNGCACCAVSADLTNSLIEIAEREVPPDAIVLEASGIADPYGIAQVALSNPSIRLDGSLVVVDAETLQDLAADPLTRRLFHNQISAADLIVLSKVDLVDPARRAEAHDWLAERYPEKRVIEAVHGNVPVELVLGIDTGRDLRTEASQPTDHAHDFESVSVTIGEPLDGDRLQAVLDALPEALLRAKGVLNLADAPKRRTIYQRVGKRWSYTPAEPWGDAQPHSSLVFIGTVGLLDGPTLETRLHACQVNRLDAQRRRTMDLPKTQTSVDYNKIPQRFHKYPASDRAQKIVHEAITMDSLFSAAWPIQWSSPEGPEFHDVMAQVHAAGFKALAVCPLTDSAGGDFNAAVRALEFFLKKINEHPERYRIVRTTRDIDEAIAEGKLGMFFTHQGIDHFAGDVERVGFWRQLGYGYCLLAYNSRNWVGDGCFEPENAGLTGLGKLLIEAYNRYGMILDVSHCGEKLSLDVCAHSKDPVISSHSVAYAIAPYPRSISDARIKAIAATGGVCGINMVGGFVDLSNPDIVTTDMLFRHIDYMVDLVGIDHVGFGSDWIPDINITAGLMQLPIGQLFFPDNGYSMEMGKKGIPTPNPGQIVAALIDKLLEKGYTESDCKKFLGGNFYRVFEQVWS